MKQDIEKLLCETIEKLQFEIFLQGSKDKSDNFPEEFCTYWLENIEEKFLDNTPVSAIWLLDFNFYSNKLNYGDTFERLLIELKSVGFVPNGRGMNVPSDIKGFTGRNVQIRYLEKY